jgi:hypothetical protein
MLNFGVELGVIQNKKQNKNKNTLLKNLRKEQK